MTCVFKILKTKKLGKEQKIYNSLNLSIVSNTQKGDNIIQSNKLSSFNHLSPFTYIIGHLK